MYTGVVLHEGPEKSQKTVDDIIFEERFTFVLAALERSGADLGKGDFVLVSVLTWAQKP